MHGTWSVRVVLSVVMLLSALVACGGASPTAEPTATTETTESAVTAAPSSSADAATDAEQAPGADGTFESVLATVEGMTGPERQTALEEMATAEGGELTLYTSMTEELTELVAGAFQESVGIDVNVYRAQSGTVTQRLLEEVQAGYASGADVAESAAADMAVKASEGALVAYEPPYTDELIEGSIYDGWVATRLNLFVPNWNTNAVTEDEAPTTWKGLADPKWDGRMAMEREDYDWYMMVRDYWLEDEGLASEEVQALFQDMAEGAIAVDGHSTAAELLAAGEYDLFAHNYSYLVDAAIATGAPIDWHLVEPVPVQPNGIGLVKNAPHPATAVLFFDWLLSEEGQQVILDYDLVPTLESLVSEEYLNAELLFPDLEKFIGSHEEITAEYDELMRIAGESQ